MQKHNQKILICLSGPLLEEIDRARSEKQLSRSAFIRESVIRNLHYYNEHERDFLCFLHAQAEVNDARDLPVIQTRLARRFVSVPPRRSEIIRGLTFIQTSSISQVAPGRVSSHDCGRRRFFGVYLLLDTIRLDLANTGSGPAVTASSPGEQPQPMRRMEDAHQQVHRDHSDIHRPAAKNSRKQRHDREGWRGREA